MDSELNVVEKIVKKVPEVTLTLPVLVTVVTCLIGIISITITATVFISEIKYDIRTSVLNQAEMKKEARETRSIVDTLLERDRYRERELNKLLNGK